jgi:hypothetical protein
MGDIVVRIEKLENGYEVEIREPKRAKANKKPGDYVDPWCGYAFKTAAEVGEFIEKNLDKAKSEGDDFGSSFDAAVAEEDDD